MTVKTKSKITRLFKYNVWKVSNAERPHPMYLFTFRNACGIAALMGVGLRVSIDTKNWYGVWGTN